MAAETVASADGLPRSTPRRGHDTMSTSEDTDNRNVGLCARCRHARQLVTPRSRFWFCERSRQDKSFERYPGLRMLECRGFEPVEASGEGDPDPPEETDREN